MTSIIPKNVIQCVRLLPDGNVEIDRVQVFVDGDQVVGQGPTGTQVLQRGQDLSQLVIEPDLVAVVAAFWAPEEIRARADEMLAGMHAQAAQLLEAEAKAVKEMQVLRDQRAQLERELLEQAAQRQAQLKSAGDAISAAHRELDAEHQVLASRQEQVTADRASLFAQHEEIRKQRPQLEAMLSDLAARVAAPGKGAAHA